ncbi:golgin subfamily A member 6-like protein 25 [Hetaerina americana]|uniref:golgin subfamily A member 6-like protein 25 n=1 Tax=Hetaerina americana TaxID=62018 RepID=UPI003A7F5873
MLIGLGREISEDDTTEKQMVPPCTTERYRCRSRRRRRRDRDKQDNMSSSREQCDQLVSYSVLNERLNGLQQRLLLIEKLREHEERRLCELLQKIEDQEKIIQGQEEKIQALEVELDNEKNKNVEMLGEGEDDGMKIEGQLFKELDEKQLDEGNTDELKQQLPEEEKNYSGIQSEESLLTPNIISQVLQEDEGKINEDSKTDTMDITEEMRGEVQGDHEARITKLEEDVRNLEMELEKVNARLELKNKTVDSLNEIVNVMRERLNDRDQELEEKENKYRKLQKEISDRKSSTIEAKPEEKVKHDAQEMDLKKEVSKEAGITYYKEKGHVEDEEDLGKHGISLSQEKDQSLHADLVTTQKMEGEKEDAHSVEEERQEHVKIEDKYEELEQAEDEQADQKRDYDAQEVTTTDREMKGAHDKEGETIEETMKQESEDKESRDKISKEEITASGEGEKALVDDAQVLREAKVDEGILKRAKGEQDQEIEDERKEAKHPRKEDKDDEEIKLGQSEISGASRKEEKDWKQEQDREHDDKHITEEWTESNEVPRQDNLKDMQKKESWKDEMEVVGIKKGEESMANKEHLTEDENRDEEDMLHKRKSEEEKDEREDIKTLDSEKYEKTVDQVIEPHKKYGGKTETDDESNKKNEYDQSEFEMTKYTREVTSDEEELTGLDTSNSEIKVSEKKLGEYGKRRDDMIDETKKETDLEEEPEKSEKKKDEMRDSLTEEVKIENDVEVSETKGDEKTRNINMKVSEGNKRDEMTEIIKKGINLDEEERTISGKEVNEMADSEKRNDEKIETDDRGIRAKEDLNDGIANIDLKERDKLEKVKKSVKESEVRASSIERRGRTRKEEERKDISGKHEDRSLKEVTKRRDQQRGKDGKEVNGIEEKVTKETKSLEPCSEDDDLLLAMVLTLGCDEKGTLEVTEDISKQEETSNSLNQQKTTTTGAAISQKKMSGSKGTKEDGKQSDVLSMEAEVLFFKGEIKDSKENVEQGREIPIRQGITDLHLSEEQHVLTTAIEDRMDSKERQGMIKNYITNHNTVIITFQSEN